MSTLPVKLQQRIDNRIKENALRNLGVANNLIDFTSNDYLGLAKSEQLFSDTFQLLLNKNITHNGATGSRLLSGNHALYPLLEEELIAFYNVNSALVFNSGYDANIGFFSSVPQKGDLIFYDAFIHASIRDGIGMSLAKHFSYEHNNIDALASKIKTVLSNQKEASDTVVYVVTESVFSMDGDSPDLKALVYFCIENNYKLIVDEAHAVGVYGKKGQGLLHELKLQNKIFAQIITFGKAFGVHGAAITGSPELKAYLLNYARSFIYSTALSPHCTAAVIMSHRLLLKETSFKSLLHENIAYFLNCIEKYKITAHFTSSTSAIQSCLLTGNNQVKEISYKLKEHGFNVKAILAPTVPKGEERLRFCIHKENSKEEIGLVIKLLANYL